MVNPSAHSPCPFGWRNGFAAPEPSSWRGSGRAGRFPHAPKNFAACKGNTQKHQGIPKAPAPPNNCYFFGLFVFFQNRFFVPMSKTPSTDAAGSARGALCFCSKLSW